MWFLLISILTWKTETGRLCQFRQPRTAHLLKEKPLTYFFSWNKLFYVNVFSAAAFTFNLHTAHLKATITLPKLGTMGVVVFRSLNNLLSVSLTGTFSLSLIAQAVTASTNKHGMMSAVALIRSCWSVSHMNEDLLKRCFERACVFVIRYFVKFIGHSVLPFTTPNC